MSINVDKRATSVTYIINLHTGSHKSPKNKREAQTKRERRRWDAFNTVMCSGKT